MTSNLIIPTTIIFSFTKSDFKLIRSEFCCVLIKIPSPSAAQAFLSDLAALTFSSGGYGLTLSFSPSKKLNPLIGNVLCFGKSSFPGLVNVPALGRWQMEWAKKLQHFFLTLETRQSLHASHSNSQCGMRDGPGVCQGNREHPAKAAFQPHKG